MTPETMHAAVLVEPGRFELREVPVPQIGPADALIRIARTGICILMVEQNARQALEIADIGYVLVQGANRYTGTCAQLMADPEVRRTFLGG